MAVGLRVGQITDELGSADFVHAFFSTISGNCEEAWGAKYPFLMNHLYLGHLKAQDAGKALAELRDARTILARLPVAKLIWDIEDASAAPPWGDNIAADITALGNYFVTSVGRDMFAVFEEALQEAIDTGEDASIA
jgi:hypothetical protein